MSTHLELAPLIELVAEVRWQPSATSQSQQVTADSGPINISFQIGSATAIEEFIQRFTKAVEPLGYRTLERLFPPGMMPPFGQAAFRFRKSADDPVLLHIGAGVFTVNALPPYDSWEEFAPEVREALDALISARAADEHETPFASAIVRYIDVFDERFTRGRTSSAFISEVLGFSIQSKDVVRKQQSTRTPSQISFQLAFETEASLRVQMTVAEGQVGNARGVLLDTTVGKFGATAPDGDSVFEVLDASHSVIHEMFFGLTEDIRALMQPSGADS